MVGESGIDLSPAAIAVLEFTSDVPFNGTRGRMPELAYITSKGAYVWAAVAALVAKQLTSFDGPRRRRIEDAHIIALLYSTAATRRSDIEHAFPELPQFHPTPGYPYAAHYQDDYSTTGIFILDFLESLFSDSDQRLDHREAVGQLNDLMNQGYRELLRQELIEDPILETGLFFAILSILPFSITRKTKKGRGVHLKIRAASWRYERERKFGGEVQVNVQFETARIARIIKTGVVAAFHEATKGAGSNPMDNSKDE